MDSSGDGVQIVEEFLGCWHKRDLDGLAARIADDIRFQPDPKAAAVEGRAAVLALWAKYLETILTYDATLHVAVAHGDRVAVERTETLRLAGDRTMTLPIVGIFELDAQGRIAAWRDYWDPAMAGAPAHG